MSGYVYVVEGEGSRVKIGWTANPLERLPSLERTIGEEVYVWACIPGTRADERRLHDQWRDVCLGGEWFQATDELLAWAEGLALVAAAGAGLAEVGA